MNTTIVWTPQWHGAMRIHVARKGDMTAIVYRKGASYVVGLRYRGTMSLLKRRFGSSLPAMHPDPEAAMADAERRVFRVPEGTVVYRRAHTT